MDPPAKSVVFILAKIDTMNDNMAVTKVTDFVIITIRVMGLDMWLIVSLWWIMRLLL